jgi:5'-3' exoribonuclease 1
MHLSLFREYLDLEFSSLRPILSSSSTSSSFTYDLERIIDDFILLNIFVGNDFLPHLPGLHINEGALNRLFEIYKRVLPLAGGYINDSGKLNVERLQLILNELGIFEREHFEYEFADSNWFKGKQQNGGGSSKNVRSKHLDKALESAKAKGKLGKVSRSLSLGFSSNAPVNSLTLIRLSLCVQFSLNHKKSFSIPSNDS